MWMNAAIDQVFVAMEHVAILLAHIVALAAQDLH
jgi:hypothetical protein